MCFIYPTGRIADQIYILPFRAKHFLSTKAAMALSSVRLSDFLFQLRPPQKVLLCISFFSLQLADSRCENKQRRLLKLTFKCRYECVTWLLSMTRRRSLDKKIQSVLHDNKSIDIHIGIKMYRHTLAGFKQL